MSQNSTTRSVVEQLDKEDVMDHFRRIRADDGPRHDRMRHYIIVQEDGGELEVTIGSMTQGTRVATSSDEVALKAVLPGNPWQSWEDYWSSLRRAERD